MLPQRRKSAEEIAKLRESLGIPGEGQEESAPESVEPAHAGPVAAAPVGEEDATVPVEPRLSLPPKAVRSLRKSEQKPATPAPAAPAAPWPLVILGYLLPLTGAFLGWFAAWSPDVPEPDFPADWLADLSRAPWLGQAGFATLAAGCALGLALSGWVALKKPRSRHHAGFITILAVLIAVFGLIHHFDPTHGP